MQVITEKAEFTLSTKESDEKNKIKQIIESKLIFSAMNLLKYVAVLMVAFVSCGALFVNPSSEEQHFHVRRYLAGRPEHQNSPRSNRPQATWDKFVGMFCLVICII
jgi:hypothetical protein